jgi:hypothetical protein
VQQYCFDDDVGTQSPERMQEPLVGSSVGSAKRPLGVIVGTCAVAAVGANVVTCAVVAAVSETRRNSRNIGPHEHPRGFGLPVTSDQPKLPVGLAGKIMRGKPKGPSVTEKTAYHIPAQT